MKWYQDSRSRWYALGGFTLGLIILAAKTVIEISSQHLPWNFASFLDVQRTEPLLRLAYIAPVILGFIAGMFENQKNLSSIISKGKKEWEMIFDSFSDLIFLTDSEGNITRCNRAVIDRLKTSYAHVIGKSVSEILTPGEQDEAYDFMDDRNGFAWHGRLHDVSTIPIEVTGADPQSLLILRDITQRVKMENSLSQERNLLRTLIDNLPDRIYVKDVQGRKTISNMADWRASGGKRMEDVIGKSDFDSYPAELANKFWADDKSVLDSGVSIKNREEPGLDVDGNPVWVMTTKVPLRDEEERVVGLVGIGRNITNQKKQDEKLRQLSCAVEQSVSTIVITDLDGNIVYVNPQFTATTGYDLDEVMGKNPRILKSGYTSQQEYQRLWDSIRSGTEWRGEFQNLKKNGELYWEYATISPILNEAGKIAHFLAV
jgi:PAS domain S-box-containing protein